MIRRIHVTYYLEGVADEARDTAERVHALHADFCPVARSVRDAIEITTELRYPE